MATNGALVIDRERRGAGAELTKADSGTMVSTRVETEAPVEPPPRAVMVTALSCWLRTASAAWVAASAPVVDAVAAVVVVVEPANAPLAPALDWVPLMLPAGRDIDVAQGLRALPELRRHFHHHMILVLVLVDGRDLALAERVIERVVDLRGGQAQPRRRGAVDLEIDLQPLVLLVGIDVLQLRHVCSASVILGTH